MDRSIIAFGDCEGIIKQLDKGTVDLVCTSPPYFNARPDYALYDNYQEYLDKMESVIKGCHRVLSEGRFFVMNISHVIVARQNRSDSSVRIPVAFDMHGLFVKNGFEFIDDIIWKKPDGAGWACPRGQRFSLDRNPLQYKPVLVTEYILVYRKQTDRLIDWNIHSMSKDIIRKSKIKDGYQKTNIWDICPKPNKKHPAVFPLELAENIVKYYSFVDDKVMDPFAGSGTTAIASIKNGRRFVAIEYKDEYMSLIKDNIKDALGKGLENNIDYINCDKIDVSDLLF